MTLFIHTSYEYIRIYCLKCSKYNIEYFDDKIYSSTHIYIDMDPKIRRNGAQVLYMRRHIYLYI